MSDVLELPTFNPHDRSPSNIEKAVGQLLVVGFQGNGDEAPESIQRALAEDRIGGTILFRRNVRDIEQVVALTESIHRAAAKSVATPWVALDQEGGRVVRLREPLTPIPPMREIGRLKDPRDVASVAEIIATEVAALGFNLNFAPVLDVDTNPDNPVIGDRAFSNDPNVVAQMGGAFLYGHLLAGVVCCGKHFPGHGDTHQDSHLELPTLDLDLDRLRRVELLPFKKAAEADFPMLMTAHVRVPALDTVHPATLSHAIISNLLREKLNFGGVIVSDCLEMKAVAEHYSIEEMVELGLRAGVDMFLICHTEEKWRRAFDHLVELATTNDVDRFCLFQAANKITKLKRTLLGNFRRPWYRYDDWRDVIGSPEHKEIMQRINRKLTATYNNCEGKSKFDIKAPYDVTTTCQNYASINSGDPTEHDE